MQIKKAVGVPEIERALGDELGPTYKVKATSETTLRVYRNPVIWAKVHVTWSDGGTTFRVRPGGVLLVLLLNSLYTAPKVRGALDRALAKAP